MMRVLVLGSKEYPMGTNVTDTLPSGGIEIYVENLVRELVKYSISIKIITRKFKGTKSYEGAGFIEIYRVSWIKGYLLRNPTFNINAFFKAFILDYDVILSNCAVASFLGLLLSKIKRLPIVMCPAGIAYLQPQHNFITRFLLKKLERMTYSQAEHVVFLSDQEKNEFRSKLGFLPRRYTVIPTGVDASRFKKQKSSRVIREFRLDNKIIISSVGRLIEVKGILYLIKAVSLLDKDDFVLLIVGDGSERESLMKLSNSLNLQDKIIFTGFREDISDILSATDIFVLPSLSEGLPISLLEAMASGCACIVTDIGLPVENNQTCLVVPSTNSEAIANAIVKLLANPELRHYIGENAREYVKREHTWEKAGEKYMELFNRLKNKEVGRGDNTDLNIILDTSASLKEFEKLGFLSRFERLVREYSKQFNVNVYSCDSKNYSENLRIKHHSMPIKINIYWIRHILYYLFLIFYGFSFKKGIVRVFGVSIPILLLMKHISKSRVVMSYHYDWSEQAKIHHGHLKGVIAPFIEKLSFASADLIFAVTPRLGEKAIRKYHKKAVVVPNFVDFNVFKPGNKKRDFILYVGRLHWLKGIAYLIEAFYLLNEKYNDIELYIVGSGDDKKQLKSKVKEIGLNKKVKFFGSLEQREVAKMMGEAKCFVLPTITMEGHPKALIEAMASGTACVVSDVRGNREIIKDKENGLIVPPKNPKALSKAIELILIDEKIRRKLERGAREESKKYSIENTIGKEVKILKELCEKNVF